MPDITDTNEKLEAIQKVIDSLKSDLDKLKVELKEPRLPGAKQRLQDLSEDATLFFSRSYSKK